jgi:hypothetical protein
VRQRLPTPDSVNCLFRLSVTLAACAVLTACQLYKSQAYLGWTQAEATGLQIVSDDPPSLAWKRLQAHADLNGAVKTFLQTRGMPDYLLEDNGLIEVRLCCFYEKKNEAWLILSKGNHAPSTRILGPEPIGEKDRRLFKAIRELQRAAAAYGQEG